MQLLRRGARLMVRFGIANGLGLAVMVAFVMLVGKKVPAAER